MEIIEKLGNKCSNPYNLNHGDFLTDARCLQIDHVHGDGKKDREIYGKSFKFLQKVLADSENNYQLLCANCNWIKRHINHETKPIKTYQHNISKSITQTY